MTLVASKTRGKQNKLHVELIPGDKLQDDTVDKKLHAEPIPAEALQSGNADKKIPYDDGVEKGRNLVSSMKESQFELGLIAYQLEPKYGEQTLERYAEEIGIDYGTLKSYRTAYRAWKDMPVRPKSFSVAKALNRHPRKAEIIQENPDITVNEAEEKMREWKRQRHADEKGKTFQPKHAVYRNKKKIVHDVNNFLSAGSGLTAMILEIKDYPEIDLSHVEEIVTALAEASLRINTLIEDVFQKFRSKEVLPQSKDEIKTVEVPPKAKSRQQNRKKRTVVE
jgi:hypothetical protein